jgi:hypothetical protein
MDDHETPALDALNRDVDRLRAGCSLLERIWQAMDPHGPFPNSRLLSTQEVHARDLRKAIEKAIKASVDGRAKDAIQDMLEILNNALDVKEVKIPKDEQEKREIGHHLVIDMQTHFGFDDNE